MSDQIDLFADGSGSEISLPDAKLDFFPGFIGTDLADRWLTELQQSLNWEQSTITMYGKPVLIPRMNAWYGDDDCDYRYSGLTMTRNDWSPLLLTIRQLIQDKTGYDFNSVLANWYRDGNDSVGWHSDDEPELGKNPVIASISLGTTRRFVMKHRRRKDLAPFELSLSHGSLLVMSGSTQHFWYHTIPKQRGVTDARINLTFRQICN
ncbi:MAG: alpha-ketoglutarate-dependent dioxygenase AlkB [Candidatus Pelagadaptatus aseana]|uniref:alpha-ketoglutarate-dependent dioxygenase AlkB family protein n=1 Tax=Candidatus Pelagadaptatus aseana TaxID=3120508 RepID=UPI0039B2BF20